MCGLVGIVSKLTSGLYQVDLDLFEQMLLCDSVRGQDSTGSFVLTKNTQARIIKHNTHPMNLFSTEEWINYHKFAIREGQAIIGHNRAATFGEISNENAHPFYEGDIVLMHNGTILNHKSLKNTDVDSHAICHSFMEIGYKETLKKINGAWALIWYNLHENKLYLTRNEDRPLGIIETSQEIYIASEIAMMQWLLARQGKTIAKEDIYILKPFDLITISLQPFKLETENIKEDVQPVFSGHHSPNIMEDGANEDIDNVPFVTETGHVKTNQNFPVKQESNNTLATYIHPLFQSYPRDTEVIFIPWNIEKAYEDGQYGQRFRVIGQAYLPGKPLVAARIMVPPEIGTTKDEIREYISETKMIAQVLYISQDQFQKDWLILHRLTPDLVEVTWQGFEFPRTELAYLAKHYKCTKCNGDINVNEASKISVVYKNMTTIKRLICDKCVNKAKHAMNNDWQAKLDVLNAA